MVQQALSYLDVKLGFIGSILVSIARGKLIEVESMLGRKLLFQNPYQSELLFLRDLRERFSSTKWLLRDKAFKTMSK